MTADYLSTAMELAPIVERVHGSHHPELTRVRELTQQISAATDLEESAALFRELRSVTSNYAVPSDGCEAYTATYEALSALDAARSNA